MNETIFQGTFKVTNGKLDFNCETQGVSFNEVRSGLTKLRDEINRQINNQEKCPHYSK